MKSFVICLLLLTIVSLAACNAAKQGTSSQYTPVPALAGTWNVGITAPGQTAVANMQATLVSVPCSTVDSLQYPPFSGQTTLASWASSCSLADNLTGQGSVSAVQGTDYFDYPPQVLIVAAATSGSTANPTTALNFYFLECSGTSTECYSADKEYGNGQGFMASASGSLSGTWTQGSYGSGTFAATEQ
jgi:hypothetical protein